MLLLAPFGRSAAIINWKFFVKKESRSAPLRFIKPLLTHLRNCVSPGFEVGVLEDKEVEDLSPYDEGTDEGPSASKASNSAHLREWESDHDISSDSSLEILDVKPAFKYQKVQYVGSDSSDSESKEGIEKNSQISKNPFKE